MARRDRRDGDDRRRSSGRRSSDYRGGITPVTVVVAICGALVVLYLFFVAVGGVDPTEDEGWTIAALVLARYMQILGRSFLERVGAPVINIHHSFLPAFAGAKPYEQARERGVKIIGATAHYVTEELDAGPIIEQDVARVTHADDVPALTRVGRDIERTVLARAVRWHVEDRVILDGHRTVVF